MGDPGYNEAVGVLFGQLAAFAEKEGAQLHIGRRASGGWTVAVELAVEGDNGLEERGAQGIGEGIAEALARVARDLSLSVTDEPVLSTLPVDVAEAYVLGRNTGYMAAHAAAESVMKKLADDLAETRKLLEAR